MNTKMKTRLISLMICIVMLVGLMPTTALAADTYTITAVSEDANKGSVTGGGTYADGESVTLTATAKEGYKFAGWYENSALVSISLSYTFNATKDRTIEARFNTIITTANAQITAPVLGGHPDMNPVSSDPDKYTVTLMSWWRRGSSLKLDEDDTFEIGNEYIIRVQFTPKSGYTLDDAVYTVNGQETSSYGTITTVREAEFVFLDSSVTYNLTVNGGTGSGSYSELDKVTITATPPANMGFKQWTGLDGVNFLDGTSKNSATATFRMPAKAVTATAVYGINNVIATATGNIKPVLGNNAETNPTFTYNFPELTTYYNSCWRYSSDGEDFQYAGYVAGTENFCVGYWRFDLSVDLNGLSISNPCTVTVNGTKWQFVSSVRLTAESPVYYLDAEGNVSVVMFEIDGVTASCPAMPESLSAGAALPHLAFTPTPSQAVVRGDGTWQQKSGDTWVNVSGAAKAGNTYRYKTLMHIDSSTTTHTFTNDVTLKVNGTSWTVDYTTMQDEGTSDVSVMVYSPEITVPAAATYTVTVTGGTASPAGPYTEGTEVTVTANPDPEGKKFKEWQIEGLSTTTSESRSVFFYMPANNVTITAIYEAANIIIESASATITEPVVGANPDFNIVSADESKYTVTVVKWNLLDGSSYPVLTADDKFVRGESYQLDVKFVANPGYEFSDSCVYNVNGVPRAAYSLIKGERRCYFDVYEIIDTINVKGVVAPVAGATPDVSGITSDTDGINVIEVKWRDKDGYAFEEDSFVAGEKYILWLKYETESDYKVADDAEVTFNISDSNILDKEITHPIIKMTYEIPAASAPTYTVSFDANSGTGTMTPVTGVSGEYELPACTFTAPSGKKFKAWSVGGSEKAVGEKITVTADTTVTAVWEAVSEYTKKGDVSAVTATATIDPALGATTSSVSFTITDPTDAAAKGVKISGSSWYKKDASSIYGWTQCSNGVDTFGEGTYRLEVQLRSESNDAKEYYAMSGETTFTVNGVQWSGKEQFRDYYASGGYGYRVFVSPEFTLGGKTLDSIAVTTPPTKTVYREGEDFDPAGMVVTATYTDSTTDSVVLYTVTDGTAMAAGKTTVTISYTEGGVTKTTTQTITVAKEYTVTVNGGTGNGKYVAGEEVTISAFVSGGRIFKEWQGTDGLTFTSGDKNSQTATFTMPAHDVTLTAVTGPAEYYVSVSGGSGTGMYEAGATVTIVADAPEAGRQFKEWLVGDGKVLRFAEGDVTSSTAKFVMPGEAVRINATYEDIPVPVTPVDTVNISGLAKPVVGEMPDNSITVNGTGVTAADDGSYWGRFNSSRFTPYYDDFTAVDSVAFREGETYIFQLYLYAEDGYEFTEETEFYFAGKLLPAPDMSDLSKSFAMVNPEDSSEALVYINMNDIAHVHVPGDWDHNDTHHWHKCTASGCDAASDVTKLPDYAEHSFVGGICTCGAHQHNWSAEWSVDETHHWHECTAGGCTATDNSGKAGYAAHNFVGGECECGVKNVITSIEISGITAPVVGETPDNSASVDKIGAKVDEEYTFWVRYDASTGSIRDTYEDGTFVFETPFREGEIYLLYVMINLSSGYRLAANVNILYDGNVLPYPDPSNLTISCADVLPDGSAATAIINPTGAAPVPVTLDSIAITTPPTKTEYTAGEIFDPAGMVVTATYTDNSTAPVTGFTVSPSGALEEGNTTITVTYTEEGVIKTATLDITVSAKKYSVTAENADGGKLTVSPEGGIREGETVTVKATPNDGYTLISMKVYDASGSFVCDVVGGSFTMPASNVTVRAKFEKELPNPARVVFDASVILEGAELEAGAFTFELSYGGRVIQTLKNPADGKMTFAPIVFTSIGSDVFYIRQIKGSAASVEYDETVYAVTVNVTLNGDDGLVAEVIGDAIVFTNTYIAPEDTTAPEETTEEPEVTTAPEETTEEPEITTAPEETTEEPEVTTAPEETTEEPEITTAPEETTEEPEVTTAPEETQPENPKTSDNSVFIIIALIAITVFGAAFLACRKRED